MTIVVLGGTGLIGLNTAIGLKALRPRARFRRHVG